MVSIESISEQFEELGIEPSNEVLTKCIELCSTYSVTDPVEFVEQWMAFSVSNLNGAEPTIKYLCDMERKEFSHKKGAISNIKQKSSLGNSSGIISSPSSHQSSPKVYNPLVVGKPNTSDALDGDDFMNAYVNKTPTTPKATSRLLTNDNENQSSPVSRKQHQLAAHTNNDDLSVTTNTSVKGTTKAIYTFGNATMLKNILWTSPNVDQQQPPQITIKQIPFNESDELFANNKKYMFDLIMDKSKLMYDRLNKIGMEIYGNVVNQTKTIDNGTVNSLEKNDYNELIHIDVPTTDRITCIGQIYSDLTDCTVTKLQSTGIYLIGLDNMRVRLVRLDFSKIKSSLTLFPGQIIIVQGCNPRGDLFYLDNVYADNQLNSPNNNSKCMDTIKTAISIVIVAGPYTHSDNLLYEPLHELIGYCKIHRPNILIMLGPFLDADHELIKNGEHLHADTFESFFEKMIVGIMDTIGQYTKVLIVSSYKDAHTHTVYPTHAYTMNIPNRNYTNLEFLPDPCVIDINNGLTIGLTSTDIIGHIFETEYTQNVLGDRIKRGVNYLFHQRSFYPLYLPHIDVPFDMGLAYKYAALNRIPNMMVLPSDLKCYVRDINNCLAINPGRLTTKTESGTANGSFARMIISPTKEETSLSNFIACQVLKI